MNKQQHILNDNEDEQAQMLKLFGQKLTHDLKSPLRTIRNMLTFMKEDLGDAMNESSEGYYQRVIKAADRMDMLIDAVSIYTKLDQKPLDITSISLSKVVDNVIADVTDLLTDKQAKVTYTNLPTIEGDANQFTQLMQHLITNGIQYCGVDHPEIHISAEQIDNEWMIFVKDNGVGIKDEFLEAIFQPFKRLHDNNKFPGSGFGLAICEKIAKRHHGKICCQSEQGSGTTFILTMPG